jgi:ATP-dependent helicase/DNAse subunit B
VELEQERLHKLLKEWLQIELDRLPFEVLEKEKDKVVIFDGMEFHLRIDRIDRLDDDSHWIIDYKTGSVNKKDWDVNRSLSEKHRHHHRIKEPQMSLYAVTCEYPLSSLFYACLKPGELGFVGDTVFDKILTKWEEDLKVGTTEFREGCAIVDPMANACTFCNLDSLCRIKNKKERPRRR